MDSDFLGPATKRTVVVEEDEEPPSVRLSFLLGRGDPSVEGLGLVVMFACVLLVVLEEERLTGRCIPRDGRDNDLRRVLYGMVAGAAGEGRRGERVRESETTLRIIRCSSLYSSVARITVDGECGRSKTGTRFKSIKCR